MFLRSLVKLNNSISLRIFVFNIRSRPKKKVFAAFWFYLNPEFWIFCYLVGISCQKTEEARLILPPSVSDLRGHRPPPRLPRNRRLWIHTTYYTSLSPRCGAIVLRVIFFSSRAQRIILFFISYRLRRIF